MPHSFIACALVFRAAFKPSSYANWLACVTLLGATLLGFQLACFRTRTHCADEGWLLVLAVPLVFCPARTCCYHLLAVLVQLVTVCLVFARSTRAPLAAHLPSCNEHVHSLEDQAMPILFGRSTLPIPSVLVCSWKLGFSVSIRCTTVSSMWPCQLPWGR